MTSASLRDWGVPQSTGPSNRGPCRGDTMGKTGRKRRARKKKGANHGKRPNA